MKLMSGWDLGIVFVYILHNSVAKLTVWIHRERGEGAVDKQREREKTEISIKPVAPEST